MRYRGLPPAWTVVFDDRGALHGVRDSAQDHIIGVGRAPRRTVRCRRHLVPEELGSVPAQLTRDGDPKMKVPRAAHVQARLDRAEFIRPIRSREELAKPRKVSIRGGIAGGARRVGVVAAVVRVPKLDESAADGAPVAVQDASADIGDNARSGCGVVIELHQVVKVSASAR